MLKVLISAPPFVNNKEAFVQEIAQAGIEPLWLQSDQVASEDEILLLISKVDAWILGDDLCSRKIVELGSRNQLKAVVKWGIGTDNIDFAALQEFGIKFSNTPNMFGQEVADLAICYLIALARKVIPIHLGVKSGSWTKITGQSMAGKKLGVVGYGDIGRQVVRRAEVMGMEVVVYEVEKFSHLENENYEFRVWPEKIEDLDHLVLCCNLTGTNAKMIDEKSLSRMKTSLNLVNVSRGGLVDSQSLVDSLLKGGIRGAALDVFESEPLEIDNPLLQVENTILGSHNASNTIEAVTRTSMETISIVMRLCPETQIETR
jgi:D-3-phosphoglycerate dehydrogenase